MAEIIIFLLSLGALLYGATWVGNSAAKIAKSFAISPVFIGVTLLSIATTLPELSIAFLSGLNGETDIGLGTLLGSPIANLGLILGIVMIFANVDVKKTQIGRNVQILLVVLLFQLLLFIFSPSPAFSGMFLISLGVVFLFLESVISKEDKSYLERIFSNISNLKNFFSNRGNQGDIFLLLSGLILLFFGAHLLIEATVSIASSVGVAEIFLATILLAIGTNIPEALNSFNSFVKKKVQLSTGNLVGASILNLTFGLGIIHMFGGNNFDRAGYFLILGTTSLLALVTVIPALIKIAPRLVGILLVLIYFAFLLLFGLTQI